MLNAVLAFAGGFIVGGTTVAYSVMCGRYHAEIPTHKEIHGD